MILSGVARHEPPEEAGPKPETGVRLPAHPLRPYWEYLSYLFRKNEGAEESQPAELSYRDFLQVGGRFRGLEHSGGGLPWEEGGRLRRAWRGCRNGLPMPRPRTGLVGGETWAAADPPCQVHRSQSLANVLGRSPNTEGPPPLRRQAPLQPLQDNLESQTYEVFERDGTKYEVYGEAVYRALLDRVPEDEAATTTTVGGAGWTAAAPTVGFFPLWVSFNSRQGMPTQVKGLLSTRRHTPRLSAWTMPLLPRNATQVLMVVGAGRGPIVAAALAAADRAGRRVRMYAVEKNPNAIVTLSHRVASECVERGRKLGNAWELGRQLPVCLMCACGLQQQAADTESSCGLGTMHGRGIWPWPSTRRAGVGPLCRPPS